MFEVKNKKILVTGGTGFIGSALIKGLIDKKAQVTSFDNDSRGSQLKLAEYSQKTELITGDICNYESLYNAVKGKDCVCHLAYINGTEFFYSIPEKVLEVAVKGMMNVIDACIENDVKQFVLASSSEVYQTPPNIPTDETAPLIVPDILNPRYSYGGGKIICELLAINYGRKFFERVIIFRPHNVYGPNMGFEHVIPQFALRLKKIIAENPGKKKYDFEIQGSGKETRSFVYIDDFIDGLIKVIENGEHLNIYHIGTMDEISIAQLAEKCAQVLGKKIKIKPTKLTQGSTNRRCPDIFKLKKLGYNAKVSLENGLAKTVNWYDKTSL